MEPYLLLLAQSNRLCKFAVLNHAPDTFPTSPPTFTSLHSPGSLFSISDASVEYFSTHPLRKLIHKDRLACRSHDPTYRANSSSPGGMFRSKHRMMWFAFNPELSAITPAMSMLFMVRSRCSKEVDSGRNSAKAMAPADVMDVDDKKSRFRAVFRVKAVRRD